MVAREPVAKGDVVWCCEPDLDRLISDAEVAKGQPAFLDTYAYLSTEMAGGMFLPCDHARLRNRRDDPNTEERPFTSLAARPIALGEEITGNYGAFFDGWSGFG